MPPDMDGARYSIYLRNRAIGADGAPGRPVLWPSAREYVSECIIGQMKHAVVSMPTGSGKSFVAELAISQALGGGWALYLVPTNALAEQIRGDLRRGLATLDAQIMIRNIRFSRRRRCRRCLLARSQ
jgi:replicative superfamily II helicase